ncbi:hypothetical protein Asp14428_62250 [Actinoplanes sp. NBRC 14428]|nr:hypothetical protein Asp14428_62250 [Actinoplanes sp. NBRC 14428]
MVSRDDLFVPDLVVLRRSGRGRKSMPIGEVPYFLRIDLRDRGPSLVLHELADGEYVPVVAAAGGGTFAMREPFAFEIDPADLLDEEG